MASLKDENKAIMQETVKIKSETKELREERERMTEELLQINNSFNIRWKKNITI